MAMKTGYMVIIFRSSSWPERFTLLNEKSKFLVMMVMDRMSFKSPIMNSAYWITIMKLLKLVKDFKLKTLFCN